MFYQILFSGHLYWTISVLSRNNLLQFVQHEGKYMYTRILTVQYIQLFRHDIVSKNRTISIRMVIWLQFWLNWCGDLCSSKNLECQLKTSIVLVWNVIEISYILFSFNWHTLYCCFQYMYFIYEKKKHILKIDIRFLYYPAGSFWAYFIADIRSYSQLKIVSFFPNSLEKIPNCKLQNKLNASLLQCLNDGICCLRHLFFVLTKSWKTCCPVFFSQFLIKHCWNSQFHGYQSCS